MKISLSKTKWTNEVPDIEAFKHGTLSLILYSPEGKDYQIPHDQDELYVIIKGNGILVIEGEKFPFMDGDVLFVPAGKKHIFENFSDDLTAWSIFWGQKGGEESISEFSRKHHSE